LEETATVTMLSNTAATKDSTITTKDIPITTKDSTITKVIPITTKDLTITRDLAIAAKDSTVTRDVPITTKDSTITRDSTVTRVSIVTRDVPITTKDSTTITRDSTTITKRTTTITKDSTKAPTSTVAGANVHSSILSGINIIRRKPNAQTQTTLERNGVTQPAVVAAAMHNNLPSIPITHGLTELANSMENRRNIRAYTKFICAIMLK
jgi:hypothetical protein